VDLSAEPGVMGRADRFVETPPEYKALARRLLGRTWLVDRVSTALRLVQSVGRGLEFVTSDGELISADGTIVVGPRQAATGVLSRRSELRACHEQARELETQLHAQEAIRSQFDEERASQEQLVANSVAAYTLTAGKLTECHRKTAAAAAQLDRLVEQQQQAQSDLEQLRERIVSSRAEIERSAAQCAAIEATAARFETAVKESQTRLATLERTYAEFQQAATDRKIAVARCEQRVETLRQQLDQVQRTRQERDQMLAQMRERLTAREAQSLEIAEAIQHGEQALADLHKTNEINNDSLAARKTADDDLRRARHDLIERVRTDRQELTTLQAQLHKLEVAITRLRHERQTLSQRMHDDYGINLDQAAAGEPGASATGVESSTSKSIKPAPTSSPQPLVPHTSSPDRNAVENEIAQLREQLNNLGPINLEALDELEQLEARFEKLSGQYRDLVDAKATLDRITQRINVDSRQLFLATVETIRGHFQELFRRLFGGGEADIIVDENEDVLECGIEIVARPPGKEACSISLLSGGEKTLTCVALLLAVFRSKPSPFCVLDEVDAALDEANIGRFTAVLKEFLSFTQFIVITHSKKTMTGADTLYGVTMEESGVSKRVSVRFEDVSDDGQILPSAIFHARQIEQVQADDVPQKRAA
jgi:chromosome segregation protein